MNFDLANALWSVSPKMSVETEAMFDFETETLTEVVCRTILYNDDEHTFDEVIAKANALPYGLAAYVFSQNPGTIARAAGALEAGVVGVNHTSVHEAETPFGGVNESGYGSESGIEGLDAYLRTKMVSEKFL